MSDTPANWYPDPTRTPRTPLLGRERVDRPRQRPRCQAGTDRSTPAPLSDVDAGCLDAGLTVGDEGRAERIHQQLTGTGHRGIGLSGPAAGRWRRHPHRADPGRQPEGQADRAEQPVQRVRPARQRRSPPSTRSVSPTAKKVHAAGVEPRPVHDPPARDHRRRGRGRAADHPTAQADEVDGDRQRRRDREIGRIVQQNVIGKINFGLEANGQQLGAIKAENWRAWNFRIENAAGEEIARVTKTWEGLAKTMFTTADNYVRPDPPAGGRAAQLARRRQRALDRHRPQAGQPRLRLTSARGDPDCDAECDVSTRCRRRDVEQRDRVDRAVAWGAGPGRTSKCRCQPPGVALPVSPT